MDKIQLIITIALFAFAAFRMYQKYIKKKTPSDQTKSKKSDFNSISDDYEPYSN